MNLLEGLHLPLAGSSPDTLLLLLALVLVCGALAGELIARHTRALVVDGSGGVWSTLNAGAGWQQESGVPFGVAALVRGDASGHWLLGRQGLVALWNPGEALRVPGCELPADVDFGAGAARDARTAWLLGRGPGSDLPPGTWDRLWLLEEGGARCRPVTLPGMAVLRALALAGEREIWVAGNETVDWGSGVVWRSDDGGLNWQRLPFPRMNDAVAIAAWPGAGAWLATTDAVWKLDLGADGLRWHDQLWLETNMMPMLSLQALDAQTLWGAGAFGQIWRTLTGGETVRP